MPTVSELVCVNCPKGCRISVTVEDQKVIDVKGYSCQKGKEYAEQETIRPMRMLTSTVRIEDGTCRVLPVITSKEIPLDLMEEAMKVIAGTTIQAPVKVDDVVISNLLDLGVDVLAARSMHKA